MKSFLAAIALVMLAACGGGSSEVAATLDGKPIYVKELDEAAKNQLQHVQTQIYEVRKNALDDVLEEKLLKKAADAKSLTVDAFLKQEVTDKIPAPSDQEMKAMYEAQKQKGAEPFEKIKDDLKSYLMRNREQMQKNQLLAGLRKDAKIEVKLDAPRLSVTEGNSPARGPENAPVKVIEFTDYQCPFCGRSRPTVNQIISSYGDKVRYVLRDFPLSFHKNSFKAHEAAHCAGDQDKYWEYNKVLFENQQDLSEENLKKFAKDVGLKLDAFDQCLSTNKYEDAVKKNIDDGVSFGVSGTPAFFVNGIMISGAQPFGKFKETIDAELGKK